MDRQAVRSLIEQSINGDKASFRKLVEFHQPFAYAVAFRLLCNDYETEEVVQEAFIRVWKNLNRFNNEMRFTTWLYKIVVNLCYDKIRLPGSSRKRIHIDMESSVIKNIESPEDPETSLINRDMAQIIRYLTEELTPRQKLVFTLSELEELSVEEITEITGLTPHKIKSNLYCARQAIREKLNNIEERSKSYAKR